MRRNPDRDSLEAIEFIMALEEEGIERDVEIEDLAEPRRQKHHDRAESGVARHPAQGGHRAVPSGVLAERATLYEMIDAVKLASENVQKEVKYYGRHLRAPAAKAVQGFSRNVVGIYFHNQRRTSTRRLSASGDGMPRSRGSRRRSRIAI